MTTRHEVIEYCLTFPPSYEDYPFDDPNWTVMRRSNTKHGFAWIFERQEHVWVNLKAEPDRAYFFRDVYHSVVPAYHMNKELWNSVILDGTVPDDEIKTMIERSYRLCGTSRNIKLQEL